MRIGKYDLHLHSISVHFTIALYPAAVFFLALSHFYRGDQSLFAYFGLMIMATASLPFSYLSGVNVWKRKYGGANVRIFARKYRFGMVLCGLGTLCTLWYGFFPEIAKERGGFHILFLLLNFAILPVAAYLGMLGGRLVFGGAH